jgi:V/A-type H+-transporting ATPase subunit I
MLEVSMFVLEPDVEAVTAALARAEILHLEDIQTEDWTPSGEWAELSNRYTGLTQRLGEMLSALGIARPIRSEGAEADLHPSRDWRDIESGLAAIESSVSAWQSRLHEVEHRLEHLKLGESQVQLLLPLDMPVEDLRRLRSQSLALGFMPTANVSRVAEALFQIPFVLIPLQQRGDSTLVLASASSENAAVLERALKSALLEPIDLPVEAMGRPSEALGLLRREIQAAQRQIDEMHREREQLAGQFDSELANLSNRARADAKLADAIRRFPKHGEVFLITGWAPEDVVDQLKAAVEHAAGHSVAMEALRPERNRKQIPSLVRFPRWLRPFTDLVTTFGLSSYHELDPTLVVTVSFLIMYGMMFGDLGHGLLLLLVGLWLWRRHAGIGIMVCAAGTSGILFGFLYGAAFGHPIMRAAWLRPLEGIWTILIAAVGGGVLLLNIGFGLNLVNAWRVRDWPRFWVEKNGLAGIALYWVLLGGGLGVAFGVVPKYILLLAPVLGVLLWIREPLAKWIWGRHSASTGEALITGFFGLLEAVTGYASNSLSFIRLGAFAVAHEGLSALVLKYSGGSWGWLVAVLGTVLVIGFEGVIVGIQALRLEYYEFFGRFFEGGGQPFIPLTLGTGGRNASVGVWV